MFARMADISAKKKQPTVHAVPHSPNIDLATMMIEKSINNAKKKESTLCFNPVFLYPNSAEFQLSKFWAMPHIQ